MWARLGATTRLCQQELIHRRDPIHFGLSVRRLVVVSSANRGGPERRDLFGWERRNGT